jgi:hypothetical protein
MLEFDEVVRRVTRHERLMNFNATFESKTDVTEEWNPALLAELVESVEIALLTKRHAEVAWIHRQLVHGNSMLRRFAQVTNQLVTKKIEGHAIVVSPR